MNWYSKKTIKENEQSKDFENGKKLTIISTLRAIITVSAIIYISLANIRIQRSTGANTSIDE